MHALPSPDLYQVEPVEKEEDGIGGGAATDRMRGQRPFRHGFCCRSSLYLPGPCRTTGLMPAQTRGSCGAKPRPKASNRRPAPFSQPSQLSGQFLWPPWRRIGGERAPRGSRVSPAGLDPRVRRAMASAMARALFRYLLRMYLELTNDLHTVLKSVMGLGLAPESKP